MVRSGSWSVALAAVLLFACSASANQIRVLGSTESDITIELATDDYSVTDVVVGGEPFFRIGAKGYGRTTEVGLPSLPLKGGVVGIPFGSRIDLEVLTVETEPLGPRRVEPAPTERVIEDGDFPVPIQEYTPDAEFYSSARTYPASVAEVGFDTVLRHQRIAQIIFHPFQYEARSGQLVLHRRIVVRLRFREAGRQAGLTPPVAPEPEWESVYRGTVLNYEDAKKWRMRPEPRGVSARMDLRPAHEAYRLRVGERGIYRLSHAELAAAGLSTALSVDDVGVYERSYAEGAQDPFVETPAPIVVVDADHDSLFDGDDYLLFFAQSFEDQFMPGGYEDRYTKDNVYWFGWGEGLAARMETRPGRVSPDRRDAPVSFRDTLRFEEDVYLDTTPSSAVVDFYDWTDYTEHGDIYSMPFSIHDIDPAGDVLLRARYQGIITGQHTLDLSIVNGGGEHAVGTFSFSGISYTMDEDIYASPSPIPASYFADGENFLKAVGSGNTGGRSGADLDWFEFAYSREYRALDGRLAFTNGGTTGDSQFDVTGFSGQNVRLFDVTSPWHPVAFDLGPENVVPDGDGYKLVFADQVGGFTRYEAALEGSCLPVLSVERSDPADLFAHEADLIVISNEAFAAGVEPLIEHREAEGIVVAHARLGQVYDEFSGGLPGPEAIRNYVMYAFNEWDRTPQFVLLVGDASEDTKDVLSSSSPNFMPTYLFVPGSNDKILASDQWYVSGPGPTYLPIMFIGRLPVGSTSELDAEVSKTLAYENYGPAAEWRDDVLFVADDLWSYATLESPYSLKTYENQFTTVSQELAHVVVESPAGADTTLFLLKRYTDPYHGDTISGDIAYAMQTAQFVRTQGATTDLIALLNQGAILVNYEGHANRTQLTHEQLLLATSQLSRNDVRLMENDGKPFIFLGFSCELSRFCDSNEGNSIDSVTEQMLARAGRGAVATFASTSIAYLGPNALLNEKVFEALFVDPTPAGPPSDYFWPRWALGGTLAKGMVKYLVDEGYPLMPQTYVLFGDPMLHIEMSPPKFRVTVEGVPHLSGDYLEVTGQPVTIVADIKDEVEIDPASIKIEETDIGIIDPADYQVAAVGDTLGETSRWYLVTYQTEIRDWSYDLKLSATDANRQSATFVLHVAEGGKLLIRDVANSPNPFTDRTSIIYLLNQSGAEVTIKLFTVGGRLIRVFEHASNELNYNEVEWDGTDQEGDTVANGLYLYVIEARGSDGTTISTPVGRMVKVK